MSTKEAERDHKEVPDSELTEGKLNKKGDLLRPQPSNDPNDPLVSGGKHRFSRYMQECLY